MVRSGCKNITKPPNPLSYDEAKTEQQREYIQNQTDYRQSVLIIGLCLDLRPSSEKLLLLKSVRTLLKKKEKSEEGTSTLGHNILNTAHTVKMHKRHQMNPLSRKN